MTDDRLKKLYFRELRKCYLRSAELIEVSQASQPPADPAKIPSYVDHQLLLHSEACASELNSRPPDVLPNDTKLLLNLAVQRLKNQVAYSKELLETIQSDKAKVSEEKAKLSSRLEEETHVFNLMKDQYREYGGADECSEASSQSTSMDPKVKGYDEINVRYKQMKQLKQTRLGQLGEFLDLHFPDPNDLDASESDVYCFEEKVVGQSLSDLIQLLVSTYLRNPYEWVTINPLIEPQYIELLLYASIVIRNSNDASQIRLEKFVD